MKLIQITDSHVFSDREKVGYNHIKPYVSLEKVLQHVAMARPDYVVFTGDNSADGSLQSYQSIRALIDAYIPSTPFGMIGGNHDHIHVMKEVFAEHILQAGSPIVFEDWVLLGINTQGEGAKGFIQQAEIASLEASLGAEGNKPCLLVCHHHPIQSGGWMDKHEWVNRHEFMQAINAYPQVKAVLYGHIHQDKYDRVGHCDFYACPSSCWQWANQATFEVCHSQPGFRIMELGKDGTFSTHIKRI